MDVETIPATGVARKSLKMRTQRFVFSAGRLSRSACGEIIHVRQILAELWSLTLRIFTHFSLSSQFPLHPCMDLNESWQGCCTTSLAVHVGIRNNSRSSNIAGVKALEMLPYNFVASLK